ncbi:unnamed protein product [Discosporangium mesarthrocarpum]
MKFTDDRTRIKKVYFPRRKSEAPENLSQYMNDFVCPAHLNLQVLRTDNGGEFVSSTFRGRCRQYLIQREYLGSYSAHEIRVAEREWRVLMDMVRRFLSDPSLPNRLWPEAVETAVYRRNRNPFKLLKGCPPLSTWLISHLSYIISALLARKLLFILRHVSPSCIKALGRADLLGIVYIAQHTWCGGRVRLMFSHPAISRLRMNYRINTSRK